MFFQFFYLNGEVEIGEGKTVSEAFANLGYGGGAIRALDFYRTVESEDADTSPYAFENGHWVNKSIETQLSQES